MQDAKNHPKEDTIKSTDAKPAEVRKIVIKTAIRAGQGKNRYAVQ